MTVLPVTPDISGRLLSPAVDRRISLVTLGVDDLDRAREFYATMGWQGREVEETVFVQAGAMALVLWDRRKLAADTGVPDTGSGFDGIVLAQNVPREAEKYFENALKKLKDQKTDEALADLENACALTVTARPTSPSPRILTSSAFFLTSPAARSSSGPIVSPEMSESSERFTGA